MEAIRVLLVEDNPGDVRLVREALLDADADLVLESVPSLAQGLDRLAQGGIDVVLLDLLLPDAGGLDALLRMVEVANGVPVIVLTVLADETVAFEAIRSGADDFLVKGRYDADSLTRSLRYAVERRHVEDLLRRRDGEFRALVENARDLIARFDRDRRLAYANPAFRLVTGQDPASSLGKPVEELPLGDAAPWRRAMDTAFARATETDLEVAVPSPRGTRRLSARLVPESAADGEVSSILLVARDVTEERAAQAELAEARREIAVSEKLVALGTLVSGVAHEVRTPLTYVANHLHLLETLATRLERAGRLDAAGRQEVHAHIGAALEGVDRIHRLVGDLRRFNSLRNGPRTPHPLDEVVAEALELFRSTHRGSIEVLDELGPVPPMTVDRLQIQQVVLNLLQNATEAAPRGGSVRVRTKTAGDKALLVVEDDGPGIPPEAADAIFRPFYTTKENGTGLGLSIVRRIVEEHGGTVSCASAPGKGSVFTVALPLAGPPRGRSD